MKRQSLRILPVIVLITLFALSCNKPEQLINSNSDNNCCANLKIGGGYELSAAEVDTFALNYFTSHFSNNPNITIDSIIDFSIPITDKQLYLVRFLPSGFVLMSDDKRNIPILAFSDLDEFHFESFDELPTGVKEWISESLLINNELETDSVLRALNDISGLWGKYLNDTSLLMIIDPEDCEYNFIEHVENIYDDCMLETSWGQRLPYNLDIGICNSTGLHKPTGCVATSMAQVMNFWEYPENEFDWDILENDYDEDDVSASAYEVAELMEEIGDEVLMVYTCTG